jgi:hypothetical protein
MVENIGERRGYLSGKKRMELKLGSLDFKEKLRIRGGGGYFREFPRGKTVIFLGKSFF